MNSFKGYFLVAAPHQLDPNFAGTVIMVVKHSGAEAFGVILNCPKEQRVCTGQQYSSRRLSTRARLHFGGPVTGPLMAVHTQASLGERRLLPGVFFSGKEKNVLTLMREAEKPLMIFAGYAGWGSGQLDYEVEQGIWHVVPATPAQIFSEDADLWVKLSRQASRLRVQMMFNIKYVPADPLLN